MIIITRTVVFFVEEYVAIGCMVETLFSRWFAKRLFTFFKTLLNCILECMIHPLGRMSDKVSKEILTRNLSLIMSEIKFSGVAVTDSEKVEQIRQIPGQVSFEIN